MKTFRTADVIINREAKRVVVNITRPRVVLHSPDGYEYGYGGSGPADLALNILNDFVPPESDGLPPDKCWRGSCSNTASRLHQKFKFDVIANLPQTIRTHRIPAAEIIRWIDEHAGQV